MHVIRSFLETATCVGISAVSIWDKMFDWCLLFTVIGGGHFLQESQPMQKQYYRSS